MNPETELATKPANPPESLPPRAVWENEVVAPDITHLVIEDGIPVDGFFAEKQYRLLTGPLYDNWPGPADGRPFVVFSDVGLFFTTEDPPLVPDVMLSLGVRLKADLRQKKHNSYFLWEFGKPPDVVIEIVSDRRGQEYGYKKDTYARIGVGYYVIFDPLDKMHEGELRSFINHGGIYQPLEEPHFATVGLGLKFWDATYEGMTDRWLRWCDAAGNLILTGQERGAREAERAETAGREAEQARQQAEQARQQAEQARQQAESERQRREKLEAQLRALGIDPEV
jgi:Uma2 family endonuclease